MHAMQCNAMENVSCAYISLHGAPGTIFGRSWGALGSLLGVPGRCVGHSWTPQNDFGVLFIIRRSIWDPLGSNCSSALDVVLGSDFGWTFERVVATTMQQRRLADVESECQQRYNDDVSRAYIPHASKFCILLPVLMLVPLVFLTSFRSFTTLRNHIKA